MIKGTKDQSARWRKLLALLPGYDCFHAVPDGWFFDCTIADKSVAFFPDCLQFIEAARAGSKFEIEPWQQAIVGAMFGWLRPDGTRRYRECFCLVARKNGKTPLAAGILLRVMFTDGELGAQIYSAAADRDQAALIFRHADAMVAKSPFMAANSRVYRSFKSIEYPRTNSIYRALSSEASTKHGLSTHFAVIDELHAHRNRELFDVINTSTGARRQPLLMTITTADYNRESICNEKYDYAAKVRDGLIDDPAFLPVIYEASKSDDWRDPKTWAKANPNLGVSISREYLERECKRAQESPAYLNTFLRLHLNLRTDADVAWLNLDAWDACGDDVYPEHLRGRQCYLGLDLSSKTDLSALALVFPPVAEGERWNVLVECWCPAENAQAREKRDRVPYSAWAREGWLTLTEGNVIDYDRIKARVLELASTYEIREVAFDPWNATQIALQLQGEGLSTVEVRQGVQSLGEATKEFEAKVISRNWRHQRSPLLRWMVSNTMVEQDANGNIRVSKRKSTGRIDGVAAIITALVRAISAPVAATSVYESRGFDLI